MTVTTVDPKPELVVMSTVSVLAPEQLAGRVTSPWRLGDGEHSAVIRRCRLARFDRNDDDRCKGIAVRRIVENKNRCAHGRSRRSEH